MINIQIVKLSAVLTMGIFVSSCAVQNTSAPGTQTNSLFDSFSKAVGGIANRTAETLNRVAKGGPAIVGPVYRGYFNGHYVTCQPGGIPSYETIKGIAFNPVPGLCDTLIANGTVRLVASESAGTTIDSVPTGHRKIEQTELNLIFEKYQQPGGGVVAVWPRVVITLIDAPAWHLEDTAERAGAMITKIKTYPGRGCWKLKAKIWESVSKSRDVAPFYRCTEDHLRKPINSYLIAYQIWSGIRGTSLTRVTPGSTGIRRTDGPSYPDTPMPTSAVYQRTRFSESFTADVACGILTATGIDFENFEDHRLWFNLAAPLEPK